MWVFGDGFEPQASALPVLRDRYFESSLGRAVGVDARLERACGVEIDDPQVVQRREGSNIDAGVVALARVDVGMLDSKPVGRWLGEVVQSLGFTEDLVAGLFAMK